MSSTNKSELSRRSFTKKVSAGAAALGLSQITFPSLLAANPANNVKLKVGVVGLGGRGNGAVNDILSADPNTELWAVGDIFESRVKRVQGLKKKFGGRVSTGDGEREFVGFDSFQKVIDSGVDIVLLTSTPAFRPQHFEAAIAAGKHVFMEKPFALDVPGVLRVVETSKKAEQAGLSVLTGLVWRYSDQLMELHKRVQDGAIGEIISTTSSYCGGGRPNQMPDPKFKPPGMTDMEWAMRYWQNLLEFSGDGALEFMIHGIDRMAWAMDDQLPVHCFASGGNIKPLKGSNNWDSFHMNFEYANGSTATFMGRQIRGTFAASGDIIHGTKGRAVVAGKNAYIERDGKRVWEKSSGLGYGREHEIFTKHIRQGKVYNDVSKGMANSHLVALMGRTAAYTGQLIRDKQLLASKDVLFATEGMNFETPFTARETALQGVTKFV